MAVCLWHGFDVVTLKAASTLGLNLSCQQRHLNVRYLIPKLVCRNKHIDDPLKDMRIIFRCDTYSRSMGWGSLFHHSRVWSTRKNSSSVAVSTYFLIVRRSLYATKKNSKTCIERPKYINKKAFQSKENLSNRWCGRRTRVRTWIPIPLLKLPVKIGVWIWLRAVWKFCIVHILESESGSVNRPLNFQSM